MQMAVSQRQRVAAARRNAASRVDDITFRNLLLESEVLSTRSEVPWRCDILLDLVEGPLRDPKRLEEATKATKFMSRLLGFFHPYSLRYSDMPRTKVRYRAVFAHKHEADQRFLQSNEQWTRLACTLLETLLQTPEGYEYLAEDQMLRQIAESLFQIDTVGLLRWCGSAAFSSLLINSPVFRYLLHRGSRACSRFPASNELSLGITSNCSGFSVGRRRG